MSDPHFSFDLVADLRVHRTRTPFLLIHVRRIAAPIASIGQCCRHHEVCIALIGGTAAG